MRYGRAMRTPQTTQAASTRSTQPDSPDGWRLSGLSAKHLNDSDEWSVENPHNRPVMQRDNLRYEVAAHRGSASTGLPHEEPALTRPAGKKTVDSVNRFREDLVAPLIELADLIPGTTDPRDPDAPPFGTWILLYHPADDGIHCEFSLPSGMTSDGTIEGWLVRVMLGTVTDDAVGEVLRAYS
jgi:hypothetical protein